MAYSRSETLRELKAEAKGCGIARLYKSGLVRRTGKTSDTRETYTELLAEAVLGDLAKRFKSIPRIPRRRYLVDRTRLPEPDPAWDRRRTEKRLARWLYHRRKEIGKLRGLGRIKDVQVPLKRRQSDRGIGEIDLVTLDRRDGVPVAWMVELKPGGTRETLLRAVLEIETYSQQVDVRQFRKDFGVQLVRKAILLVAGESSVAYREADEMASGERENLRRLLEKWGTCVFAIPANSWALAKARRPLETCQVFPAG